MTENIENNEERRKSFRLDMEKELVDIAWQGEDGRQYQKKIACLDFSRGGLRVDCDNEIAVNTSVTIIFKQAAPQSQNLNGKVLRCVKQASGWFEIALLLDTEK